MACHISKFADLLRLCHLNKRQCHHLRILFLPRLVSSYRVSCITNYSKLWVKSPYQRTKCFLSYFNDSNLSSRWLSINIVSGSLLFSIRFIVMYSCNSRTHYKTTSLEDSPTKSFSHHNLAFYEFSHIFVLLKHQLWRQNIPLLLNILHRLTGTMIKRLSVLSILVVSGHYVLLDWCM